MTAHSNDQKQPSALAEVLFALKNHWKLLIAGPIVGAGVAFVLTFALPSKYTARATIFPPQQQQQTATAAAMQSLGAIAGLAGSTASLRNPADQYVSLMQSVTVSNRIVQAFNLTKLYETQSATEARDILASRVNLIASRKDGLIHIDVEDRDPKRAADMANAYIEQLRRLTTEFALTEAQQRRMFFERQLEKTSRGLARAQQALQVAGITEGALRADPKAAAESYASLKAQITMTEMKLEAMRGYLTESAPEYKAAARNLTALRSQLALTEKDSPASAQGDYIEKYREYRYQETLFELFAKQYELAKLDESREGALIQVVDYASPPERKSFPKRFRITMGAALVALLFLLAYVAARMSMGLERADLERTMLRSS